VIDSNSSSHRRTSWGRRLRERIAAIAIRAGGATVLVTITLLLLYLVLEIVPLLVAARATPGETISPPLSLSAPAARVAAGPFADALTLIDRQLGVYRYNAATGDYTALLAPGPVSAQVIAMPARDLPLLAATSGGDRISLRSWAGNARARPVDLVLPSVSAVALGGGDERLVLAAGTETGMLVAWSLVRDSLQALGSARQQWPHGAVAEVLISRQPQRLLALSRAGHLAVYQLTTRGDLQLLAETALWDDGVTVVGATLLAGEHAVIVAGADGRLAQWTWATRDGAMTLFETRRFTAAGSARQLRAEPQRKVFYVLTDSGVVQGFHATSGRELLRFDGTGWIDMALSAQGDRMVGLRRDGSLHRVVLHIPHPEVSVAALFQALQYDGYPEADYVWQSMEADGSFEPKFSLMPLLFGTLKAALYTMLICAPLAVLAAIYTAHFMRGSLRRKVKPLIELMEAMPTVVVGFLAGLWLAPWLERHLATLVLLLIGLPLLILVLAASGRLLARRQASRGRLEGWLPLVLLPVLAVFDVTMSGLASWLEPLLLPAGLAVWLEHEWGLVYEQRNALIVGIAMGIAVIPSVFSLTEDALFAVPQSLSDGGLALGATPWQAVAGVVLPSASPGIFSALMIGLARAIGETMIVLMVAGNTPIMDWSALAGMRTLSANIAMEMPEAQFQSTHYRVLLLAALLLFVFTFIFNTVAEVVRARLRRRYGLPR